MLTVRFESEADCFGIYETLGLTDNVSGTNFVMYDDETPKALFRMHFDVSEGITGVVDKIYFSEGTEEQDKTFFIHAIFFKLMQGAQLKLRILGTNKEFEKFGFKENDGNMEIFTDEINLHYMCGKK